MPSSSYNSFEEWVVGRYPGINLKEVRRACYFAFDLETAWDAAQRSGMKLVAVPAVTTPDASLPPFEPDATKRRKMLIEIEVSANFEKRLDNQWEVEREINADRWSWRWSDE